MRPEESISSDQSWRVSTVMAMRSRFSWMCTKSSSSSDWISPSAEMSMIPLQGVERGEHLEDDLREVLEVELRHVLLSDGAFVAAVPVVELGRRVAFGH